LPGHALNGAGYPASSSQYDDLQVFIHEQEVMQQLSRHPAETFQIDISDDDVPGAVEKIADWMETTGGLYMLDE
jgi:hypothetical protein